MSAIFGDNSRAVNVSILNPHESDEWPHPVAFLQHLVQELDDASNGKGRNHQRALMYRFIVSGVPRNYSAMAKLFLFSHYARAKLKRTGSTMTELLRQEMNRFPYKQKTELKVPLLNGSILFSANS